MTPAIDIRPSLLAEPSAQTYPLAKLVAAVREGSVRVPHFQRGLRWRTPDAVALIDSVLRGFPIGSLLFWVRPAPAERIRLGDVTIAAPELSEASYVVDGQQRLTTFLNVFDPIHGLDGDFALVYDLRSSPFRVRAKGRRESDDHAIPLPVLFDLPRLLRWASEHPRYADRIDDINAATQRLREYDVPAYLVRSQDEQILREIYDRMNNTGKRLTRAEAFRGLFSAADQGTTLESIQKRVETELAWGSIDADTILQAFLARRGPNAYRDLHQEFTKERTSRSDFPREDREQAHEAAFDALEAAIRFLKQAGVPHFTFLAYRFLLVVLSRFFALFPQPSPRNLILLERWYWRAALIGPVLAGGTTNAVRTLAGCIRAGEENESVQRLLDSARDRPLSFPRANTFGTSRASGRIMLCALWHHKPLSPDTGEAFSGDDLALEIGQNSTPRPACPEVFPRQELPGELSSSLANRVLAPGIPLEVVHSPKGWNPVVRESHLFGEPSDPVKMVRTRETALQKLIDDFLRVKTGQGLDDSPSLDSLNLDDDLDKPEPPQDDQW